LGDLVEGARCLDLFAGTGAIGIEALSRGATHASFVDRSARATAAIRANLERTRLDAHATVVTADVERFLARGPAPHASFDVAFLDPPYEHPVEAVERILAALGSGWLAPEGWTVILTRGHKGARPALPVHWAVRRQLRYGDSLLTQYREERWA
jgi:16S rRNA (guanine966-N2)-methyltransferase